MSGVIVQCGHWAAVSADELQQVIAPGVARRYAPPPPTAVRLAADLRPSADGSAVRTSLVAAAVAKLQAASVPIA